LLYFSPTTEAGYALVCPEESIHVKESSIWGFPQPAQQEDEDRGKGVGSPPLSPSQAYWTMGPGEVSNVFFLLDDTPCE